MGLRQVTSIPKRPPINLDGRCVKVGSYRSIFGSRCPLPTGVPSCGFMGPDAQLGRHPYGRAWQDPHGVDVDVDPHEHAAVVPSPRRGRVVHLGLLSAEAESTIASKSFRESEICRCRNNHGTAVGERFAPAPEAESNQMSTNMDYTEHEATNEPFADAYEHAKDKRDLVVVALAARSTRVLAMARAGMFSPGLQSAIEEAKGTDAVLVVALHREGIDGLFAEVNYTPVHMPIEEGISTMELVGWPVMLMVSDEGIGMHVMRAAQVPELDRPICGFSWPEMLLADSQRS